MDADLVIAIANAKNTVPSEMPILKEQSVL
jgi:hypothetical protein